MKKFTTLFIVMALAMFAAVFTVSAQEASLPAIDEATAEPYLGTWYMSKMCYGTDCIDLAGLGAASTITFNPDNTAVSENEDSSNTVSWYMEDGVAQTVETIDNETTKTPLQLDENGNMFIESDGATVTFVRELAPIPGTGALKEDATLEDFAGEWFLNSFSFEENGDLIPASLFGVSGTLTIKDSTMDITVGDEGGEKDVPFELKDGKLYATSTDKDENGKDVENTVVFEYHADNSIIMRVEGDGLTVFVREENLTAGISLFDALSGMTEISELPAEEPTVPAEEPKTEPVAEGESSGK